MKVISEVDKKIAELFAYLIENRIVEPLYYDYSHYNFRVHELEVDKAIEKFLRKCNESTARIIKERLLVNKTWYCYYRQTNPLATLEKKEIKNDER